MNIPDIAVKLSDLDFNTESVADLLYSGFSDKNKSLPFKERVFHTFPALAGTIKDGMADEEIYHAVKNMMFREYEEHSIEMQQRIAELSEKLGILTVNVIPRMLQLFEVEWPRQANITCYLGLYSVFPRNVLTKEYWMHYKTPDDVIMRASLHEIDHFILFEKWKAMHGYTWKEEPDHPDVLWFLEEMTVDPTLNTPEIQEAAPYPQKAYRSFYENTIQGVPIEDYIIKFFKERRNMADFLDTSYQFISDNHKEIIMKCG